VARTRTTKKLAQRIDLNYFKRPTSLKRARFWLSLLLPLAALVWIAWRGFSGDHRVYSSGRLSQAHAVLEKECSACHKRQAGAFSARAANNACLDCHDGPVHHPSQVAAPDCSTCHSEHRGGISLSVASDQVCAECHADLKSNSTDTQFAARIHSLQDGHPEFAALRSVAGVPATDPSTIKLNHAIHMKPIRRGPNGALVNLECGNCHRPTAADADLTYSDAKYRAAKVSYNDRDEFLPLHMDTLRAPKPVSGRELLGPVKFSNACAACHLLTFDRRFEEGVPHDKPEVVHAFLIKTFQQYIAAHPSDLRVARDPNRDLSGKPLPPLVRVLTAPQWVTERTTEAEELLWRKTCKQCHTLTTSPGGSLPQVAAANTRTQWMPHAKFDHDAHRGFTCVSCHRKALTSTETSEILLPGIATCKTCHAPGPAHAESRCSDCHTYHDWSKRKEVTPKFTLPALRTGGQ
jgi:transcription elongation factor Elf1